MFLTVHAYIVCCAAFPLLPMYMDVFTVCIGHTAVAFNLTVLQWKLGHRMEGSVFWLQFRKISISDHFADYDALLSEKFLRLTYGMSAVSDVSECGLCFLLCSKATTAGSTIRLEAQPLSVPDLAENCEPSPLHAPPVPELACSDVPEAQLLLLDCVVLRFWKVVVAHQRFSDLLRPALPQVGLADCKIAVE